MDKLFINANNLPEWLGKTKLERVSKWMEYYDKGVIVEDYEECDEENEDEEEEDLSSFLQELIASNHCSKPNESVDYGAYLEELDEFFKFIKKINDGEYK